MHGILQASLCAPGVSQRVGSATCTHSSGAPASSVVMLRPSSTSVVLASSTVYTVRWVRSMRVDASGSGGGAERSTCSSKGAAGEAPQQARGANHRFTLSMWHVLDAYTPEAE